MDVTLKSPAKIGGKWHQAGETVAVTDEVAAQLGEVVIGEQPMGAPDPGATEAFVADVERNFDAAVAERAKAIAEAIVGAAVEQAVEFLSNERDQLAERVRELEAQIAAAAAPAATEPAEPSTSTPKRGGKAAKG